MAIRQEYGADPQMLQNILFRIFALMKALHDPAVMEAMVEKSEGSAKVWVHPAVIEAAALVPVNNELEFNVEELLCVARRIADEKYPDLE